MTGGVWVTGTDTGVGKTLICTALVRQLAGRGLRVAGLKPVAAGCEKTRGVWTNDDIEQLLAVSSVALAPERVSPYRLPEPCSPHLAARHAGCQISISHIVEQVTQAMEQADYVVVEGVGGFCVPLDSDYDTADLAQALDLPVVLVVGMRLGCLNHALLTQEAIRARRLKLAGWVANVIDPDMRALQENIATLATRITAPCWGVVPFLPQPARADIRLQMDFFLRSEE